MKKEVLVLKKEAAARRDGLVEAFNDGEVKEYVLENAYSIERDEENNITHIVFTFGGPFVYLDFEDSPGVIIAKDLENKSQAAIPFSVWSDVRDELETIHE